MSRIHEAQEKAEQDRAMAQATNVVAISQEPAVTATPAPVWAESVPVATAPSDLAVSATPAVAVPTDSMRFEDLRAHCAHPEWHLDPKESVFSNSELSGHAAEQFRTLRSKLYQIRASQALRTVLITSAIPQEGKTWVTNNLAQAIVRQADRRALRGSTDQLQIAPLQVETDPNTRLWGSLDGLEMKL